MKRIELEFGDEALSLSVPETADMLPLPECAPLRDPAAAIRRSLLNPIGAPGLPALIEVKKKINPGARAIVVVSDNTRPVPYLGEQGILEPVLDILAERDIRRIEILVANGTHRALPDSELKRFLPGRVFETGMTITNHVCTDRSALRHIGRTGRGTEVWINRRYLDADIKILTGLVEPHFMAGVSGGCKSVCPGLVGETATHTFHSAAMMAHDLVDSLVVEGNPCHEESLETARMAGADFIVNATVDRDRRLTGVYSGDMHRAHMAAAARVVETNAILIGHEYDLVITHAGFVGINHYQAVKACVEAVKAVKAGGSIIVTANHTDIDPVGGENYKRVLPLLKRHGVEGLLAALLSPGWTFVPDQWEVQMWARVIKKLKLSDHLIYCAPRLAGDIFRKHALPGVDGGEGIKGLDGRAYAERMMQAAIDGYLAEQPAASVAILPDGPYGVPVLRP